MSVVGIVGDSERVRAIAQLSVETGTRVLAWSPEGAREGLAGVTYTDVAAFADVPLIFFDPEIASAREVARELGDHITGRHVIVHLLDGLEPGSAELFSDVLREETATHRIGFLTGPMRGKDVEEGLGAAATSFSRFPEVHQMVEDALVSDRFRLYRSSDLVGAQIAAACVHAIAFVYGVGVGMKQGASVGATVFARGLAETSRVVEAAGGEERTVFGMSGAGNLFARVGTMDSVDVALGLAAVEFGAFDRDKMSERFGQAAVRFETALGTLEQFCSKLAVDTNINSAAFAIVNQEKSTAEAALELMTLPVFDE